MEAGSGVLDGLLSLPQGGGSLQGLGDRFQPDLLKGTGNYSVPISVPKGPAELSPSLSLRYSTGLGNGPFGLGWSLGGIVDIRRKTDRGVPRYDDETDQYVFGGAETLVPVGGGRYRPRTETKFFDISRQEDGWRIRTKEGRSHLLGASSDTRVNDGERVLAWLVERETDPAGNTIEYRYERDRRQLYLVEVIWGIYSLRFVYEDRPDVLHDGRGGFPVITARRCAAIERRCESIPAPLLSRYSFVYEQAEGSALSLLTEVRLTGFGEGGEEEESPVLRLGYSAHTPADARYRRVGARGVPAPPLGRNGTTLVDMDGDGLPDVLEARATGHRYWPNLGDGTFGPVRPLPVAPIGMEVGRPGVSFGDLTGDGTVDLFRADVRLGMAVANTGAGAWAERPIVFGGQLPLSLTATQTRLVDLDGDGVVDLLQSGPGGFLLTYNRLRDGWTRPETVSRIADASVFPDVDLSQTGVHLADMNGDGLSDVVFVASGRVEYWPHYGYGRWGERVRMEGAPAMAGGFDPNRLFLADLDGDGTADLIYVDFDRVFYWLNRSGAGWSDRYQVPFVPPPDIASLQFTDLLGNGTGGLVWNSPDRADPAGGYRYLDLVPRKPYLLTRIDTGLAGLIDLTYITSSELRAADERAGQPWHSFLPFPVHVVSEMTQTDQVTGRAMRTRFRYHRGYYDGAEREFRGFESVSMEVLGDAHTPGVRQETRFFQGAMPGPVEAGLGPRDVRARERALSGSPVEVRSFEVADDGTERLTQSAVLAWDPRVEFSEGSEFVHFPHLVRTEARDHADGEPDRVDLAEYEYDTFGNLLTKRRSGQFDGTPPAEALRMEQRLSYTTNEEAWLVGLPASVESRDADGRLLAHTLHFYDGPAFQGLPAGKAEHGLLRRTEELALADHALPDGYAALIDPAWGLVHKGDGFYRTSATYDLDARGNIAAQRDAVGAESRITYSNDGQFPIRMVDPEGGTTEIQFDPRTAQPLEVRNAGGVTTRYRYSPLGRLRAQFDTTGDGSLQLTQVLQVDHGEVTATPLRPPRVTSIKPLGPGRTLEEFLGDVDVSTLDGVSVSSSYFDGEGYLLQQVGRGPNAPDGSPQWVCSRRRDYTHMGRAAADYPNEFVASPEYNAAAPSGPPVRFFYTGAGQTRRIQNPDGGRLEVRYLLNRVEKRDAEMPDDAPPMLERYDAWGNLVEVTQEAEPSVPSTTRYTVDPLGRQTEVVDAAGRVLIRSTFAGPGPPIRIGHGDAGERSYWRDARGLLRRREDSLGKVVATEYDAMGRVAGVVDITNDAQPIRLRSLTYQGNRLVEATELAVTLQFEHDAVGRTVTKRIRAGGGPAVVTRREFGLRGEPTAVEYPDGTRVEYSYDPAGSLIGASGFVDGVEYDPHGSPVRIAFAGGADAPHIQYEHDSQMRRLRSASLEGAEGVVRRVSLTHDRNGHITSLTDRFPADTFVRGFSYDGLYRLTGATLHAGDPDGPMLRDDRYGYSATGDLLRNDESMAGPLEYGDAAHAGRLRRVRPIGGGGPVDLEYDEGGRLVSFGNVESLAYDVWDRLVEARLADGTAVRMDYDHEGSLVRKVVERPGAQKLETRYVERLYESGPEGERLNVYLGRLLVASVTKQSGGPRRTTFLLTDHLGSVLAGCDADGATVHQQMYSPFGLTLRPGGGHDAYTGNRVQSEMGLILFGARWYAPTLGRFITPDWFITENPSRALRLPQGLNAYSYAINNPLSFRDPTGMWFGMDDLIVAAVGFVVGFVAGTIYGLATGHSLGDSLLRGLEAGILGAVGAWLAWNTAGLALGLLGVSTSGGIGFGIMVSAAVIAGLNGTISGMTRIYDWSSPVGWAAFLSDSTWGLIGTGMADLLHIVNLFYGSSRNYRPELSERQNRHVYDGGFGFGNYAFTQGNVTSNLNGRRSDLVDHETLHIWQSRIFGPIFTVTYVVWMVVGTIVGLAAAPFTDQSWKDDIRDVAYLDNPWETWAYDEGGDAKGGSLSWA